MNWREKANEILAKLKKYREDTDGWKQAKKSNDVTVWSKPSPDWNGMLYKAESTVDSDPETVFEYIDPSPEGPRSKWDKAIKELQIVERFEKDLSVCRTITHSAFGGLISARDFTDLVINVKTDDFLSTSAAGVEHSGCPPGSDHIRGMNHPCSITCYTIPGEPNKTRVTSYIQTDLGGMLPKALIENALPSNMCDFFTSLRGALKADGKWKGASQNGTEI